MEELKQARQGRLRPVRLGLPAFPRHRRVHRRAEADCRTQGVSAGDAECTISDPACPATHRLDACCPRHRVLTGERPMPATVTTIAPKRSAGPPPRRTSARRPFRDNPRLILAGIVALVAILITILAVANRTPRLAPDFLSEVVLYALSAADLTMLAALVFVLARNIIKLIVERRRALPFARFRAKLVALLLGMTLVPALLVLVVGSELIRESVEPMVQRADGRDPVVGEQDCRRLLPGAPGAGQRPREPSGARVVGGRSGGGRRAADSQPGRARRHAAARQDGAGVARRRRRRRRPRASSRSSMSPPPGCRPGTGSRRPSGWRCRR